MPTRLDSALVCPPLPAARSFLPVGPKAALASPTNFDSAMKKENTVKAHADFDRIIQKGACLKTPHFRLHYLPASLDHTRIGIAVGKANGGAVRRVRLKRQVRAMVEKREPEVSPLDIIIVIRPEYRPEQFHENEMELLSAFHSLKENQH